MKNTWKKVAAVTAAALSCAAIVQPAHAYSGHVSPFDGLEYIGGYPIFGVTIGDLYTSGISGNNGYSPSFAEFDVTPTHLTTGFFNVQMGENGTGDVGYLSLFPLAFPSYYIPPRERWVTEGSPDGGAMSLSPVNISDFYAPENIGDNGDFSLAMEKMKKLAAGNWTLRGGSTPNIQKDGADTSFYYRLSDVSCDIDMDEVVKHYPAAEGIDASNVNNCLWSNIGDRSPDRVKRLKTYWMTTGLIDELFSMGSEPWRTDFSFKSSQLRAILREGGFTRWNDLDRVIAQVKSPYRDLDNTFIHYDSDEEYMNNGPGKDLEEDRRLEDVENMLFSLPNSSVKGLPPVPIKPGDPELEKLTTNTATFDNPNQRRSAASENRRIILQAYYDLFTGKKNYRDYPETMEHFPVDFWHSGRYVGTPSDIDVYATLLSFAASQAIRGSAEWNARLIHKQWEAVNTFVSPGERPNIPEVLMDAYEAFANYSSRNTTLCEAEHVDYRLAHRINLRTDKELARVYGLGSGPMADNVDRVPDYSRIGTNFTDYGYAANFSFAGNGSSESFTCTWKDDEATTTATETTTTATDLPPTSSVAWEGIDPPSDETSPSEPSATSTATGVFPTLGPTETSEPSATSTATSATTTTIVPPLVSVTLPPYTPPAVTAPSDTTPPTQPTPTSDSSSTVITVPSGAYTLIPPYIPEETTPPVLTTSATRLPSDTTSGDKEPVTTRTVDSSSGQSSASRSNGDDDKNTASRNNSTPNGGGNSLAVGGIPTTFVGDRNSVPREVKVWQGAPAPGSVVSAPRFSGYGHASAGAVVPGYGVASAGDSVATAGPVVDTGGHVERQGDNWFIRLINTILSR